MSSRPKVERFEWLVNDFRSRSLGLTQGQSLDSQPFFIGKGRFQLEIFPHGRGAVVPGAADGFSLFLSCLDLQHEKDEGPGGKAKLPAWWMYRLSIRINLYRARGNGNGSGKVVGMTLEDSSAVYSREHPSRGFVGFMDLGEVIDPASGWLDPSGRLSIKATFVSKRVKDGPQPEGKEQPSGAQAAAAAAAAASNGVVGVGSGGGKAKGGSNGGKNGFGQALNTLSDPPGSPGRVSSLPGRPGVRSIVGVSVAAPEGPLSPGGTLGGLAVPQAIRRPLPIVDPAAKRAQGEGGHGQAQAQGGLGAQEQASSPSPLTSLLSDVHARVQKVESQLCVLLAEVLTIRKTLATALEAEHHGSAANAAAAAAPEPSTLGRVITVPAFATVPASVSADAAPVLKAAAGVESSPKAEGSDGPSASGSPAVAPAPTPQPVPQPSLGAAAASEGANRSSASSVPLPVAVPMVLPAGLTFQPHMMEVLQRTLAGLTPAQMQALTAQALASIPGMAAMRAAQQAAAGSGVSLSGAADLFGMKGGLGSMQGQPLPASVAPPPAGPGVDSGSASA